MYLIHTFILCTCTVYLVRMHIYIILVMLTVQSISRLQYIPIVQKLSRSRSESPESVSSMKAALQLTLNELRRAVYIQYNTMQYI